MIQIFIDNKLIDLDNTNISLQKEFEDEVENIPTEVEYSYTVSIPATMNNREIFGFSDVFDVANKFKRLYNADLYVDEQLILSGKFKVTSIESGYYKGNIYNPKKKTISEILGERNLNEINPHWKPMNCLEDFDKINNYVCDLSKDINRLPEYEWNNTTHPETSDKNGDVCDNHVVYPYMLYGLPMHNPDETPIDMNIYTQDLQYMKHSITEDKIYPSFNVVSVLKDIFKTEGYNLTGNIIDGNMKDFFNGLYQTFQFSQADYIKQKEVPYYLFMEGGYWNWCYDQRNDKYNPSPSIEIMDLFDSPEWHWNWCDDEEDGGGSFQYGVDNPWTAGIPDGDSIGHLFNTIAVLDDDYGMFAKGSNDPNTGIIIVPKSGWYKIKLKGHMRYTHKGNQILTGVDRYIPIVDKYIFNGDILIGGTTDEADNSTLAEMPFEIQLKKGYPKDNPRFYSFNSFVPMNAVEYYEDKTVAMDKGGDTYLNIPDGEAQRRYAKNGGTAYVKQIGDYNSDEFVCGARLGGAWASTQWECAWHGEAQRRNRAFGQLAGMALPNPSKPIRVKHFEDEGLENPYKDGSNKKFNGYFLKLADKNTNANYEYAKDTAQCLVRYNNAYSNFGGYNTLTGNDGSYSWDTTSNYGAVTWEGAETSSAKTTDAYNGDFDVNTCVWLEAGDTLYLEFLMPLHNGGKYLDPDCNTSSEWYHQYNWINATEVTYRLSMAYINGNSDWKPRVGDGIGDWTSLSKKKLTNVNQFLPNVKCNDYVEKFLKTFNLQLTMKDSNTFSIDTINGGNMMGNIIDIDKICNIDDAEFKPLKSESVKEYKWKIDNTETGYAQGNESPFKNEHGESHSGSSWYESGYTGSATIENDTNSSGSVKKTEAPWSYNWYKTIHFLHNYIPSPLTEEYADISVISDSDMWKEGMTFAVAAKETPKTSKTMRLFTLKKNQEMNDRMFSYISFKYGEKSPEGREWRGSNKTDQVCNLVLPSNYYETIDIDGTIHRLHLDYEIMNNTFDGKCYNQSLMDVFFSKSVQGGYDIEVPIRLSNADYAATKQGTLYKLHDGLYKIKSIEGHDVNKKDNATLTLTTLK